MKSICCDKNNSVAWVRCTQFAGDHYFCEECAKAEPDFGLDYQLSDVVWMTYDKYQKSSE